MNFLCNEHKQVIQNQSVQTLDEMINNWISSATEHYQHQRWSYALPYIGCALEACWIKCQKQPHISQQQIAQNLCLAVYCHNLLTHQGDPNQGEAILLKNWQTIMAIIGLDNNPDLIKHCLHICQNNELHQELITTHTDWPFIAPSEETQLILH